MMMLKDGKLSVQKQKARIEKRKDGIHLFLNENEIGCITDFCYIKDDASAGIKLKITIDVEELVDVICCD